MILIADAPAKNPDHAGHTEASAQRFIEESVGENFYVVDIGRTRTGSLVDKVKGKRFEGTGAAKLAEALTGIVDEALADPRYWRAPPKFLRNLENAYARTLNFDLTHVCDGQDRAPVPPPLLEEVHVLLSRAEGIDLHARVGHRRLVPLAGAAA